METQNFFVISSDGEQIEVPKSVIEESSVLSAYCNICSEDQFWFENQNNENDNLIQRIGSNEIQK